VVEQPLAALLRRPVRQHLRNVRQFFGPFCATSATIRRSATALNGPLRIDKVWKNNDLSPKVASLSGYKPLIW
jgi:hypothetical protein